MWVTCEVLQAFFRFFMVTKVVVKQPTCQPEQPGSPDHLDTAAFSCLPFCPCRHFEWHYFESSPPPWLPCAFCRCLQDLAFVMASACLFAHQFFELGVAGFALCSGCQVCPPAKRLFTLQFLLRFPGVDAFLRSGFGAISLLWPPRFSVVRPCATFSVLIDCRVTCMPALVRHLCADSFVVVGMHSSWPFSLVPTLVPFAEEGRSDFEAFLECSVRTWL